MDLHRGLPGSLRDGLVSGPLLFDFHVFIESPSWTHNWRHQLATSSLIMILLCIWQGDWRERRGQRLWHKRRREDNHYQAGCLGEAHYTLHYTEALISERNIFLLKVSVLLIVNEHAIVLLGDVIPLLDLAVALLTMLVTNAHYLLS